MQIKKCPDCRAYLHFEKEIGIRRCWNCGVVTNFLEHPSFEAKVWLMVGSGASLFLMPFVNLVQQSRYGRIALVLSLPVAVVMLLICNSFQISIVQDAAAPFSR